jgi:hypothetical protein
VQLALCVFAYNVVSLFSCERTFLLHQKTVTEIINYTFCCEGIKPVASISPAATASRVAYFAAIKSALERSPEIFTGIPQLNAD